MKKAQNPSVFLCWTYKALHLQIDETLSNHNIHCRMQPLDLIFVHVVAVVLLAYLPACLPACLPFSNHRLCTIVLIAYTTLTWMKAKDLSVHAAAADVDSLLFLLFFARFSGIHCIQHCYIVESSQVKSNQTKLKPIQWTFHKNIFITKSHWMLLRFASDIYFWMGNDIQYKQNTHCHCVFITISL